MAKFKTHGVLSATTGILMGEIDSLYEVASFLLDRPAYTHELGHYSGAMKSALTIALPGFPTEANSENWNDVRLDAISKYGDEIDLPDALKGVLADGKNPITTLREMGFSGEVVTIGRGQA
ncbi:hypothetical protein [Sagittula sp. MA-2]|jgi:hypothetical protein|uniref:DUF7736 domain-containing protein n=1 Tax=Sagittula sp. MA-2 TaxID=3048007 RepID=UPI0024C250B0|nr:hypothetical protein [Sagittula sp. MA-2]WHZ35770.1 hypothetical protein QNI11_01905 [Sagittula sp. MA-2]